MERLKPPEAFSKKQLAIIEEMVRKEVSEALAKPRPRDFSLISGTSHKALSKEIAALLGARLCKENIETFSCGEKYVELLETVRNKITFLMQTCRTGKGDKDLMELFIMGNTAFHAYSEKRVAVIPYYGYGRQDKIHKKREPLTAKHIADLAKTSKIDHAIIVHFHADQEQGFFDMPVDHIKPHELFAAYFREKFAGTSLKNLVIVSTDAGGDKSARALAELLGIEGQVATVLKTRKKHNHSTVNQVVGNVKGKTCVLYDDMIDTAGSAKGAKEALIKKGANPEVYMCATHPVFSGEATKRLKAAKFKEVVTTNTLPLSKNKRFKGLKQLSVAPLIAEKMAKIIGMPLPTSEKTDKPKNNP